jgi:hypothetical protein
MLLLRDVEQLILVNSRSWSFPLKLEYHNTIVVTSSEQVDLRVSGNDPEAVIFALE